MFWYLAAENFISGDDQRQMALRLLAFRPMTFTFAVRLNPPLKLGRGAGGAGLGQYFSRGIGMKEVEACPPLVL